VTSPATPAAAASLTKAEREPFIDVLAVWRPIRKHWLTALSTAVLVTVGVGFWTMKQKRIYEASATVQFDPNPPRPLGGKMESVVEVGTGAVWDTREYYETQYQIIQSRRVSLGVVRDLALNHDQAFILNSPKGESPPDAEPVEEEVAADILRGRVGVEPVKQSRLATVRLQDANPERAARVLKKLVEVYREQNVNMVLESTDDAVDWLHTEHDKLKTELESSEMDLHRYKQRNNILSVDFADKSNLLREEMGQLNSSLTIVKNKQGQVASRRRQVAKVAPDDPAKLPATEMLQSSFLQDLRRQYVSAAKDRDGLLKGGLGNSHPDVQSANAKVETARAALLAEVKNIQAAVEGDLVAVQGEVGDIAGRLEHAKKEALDLNLLEIEYNRLRRTKENTEKIYGLLLERTKESDITRRLRVNNVSVVDEPTVPTSPVRPNVPLALTGGAGLGLLLGAGAALGRNMLDRTVKTPEDVENVLGATFLGLIPEFDSTNVAAPRPRRRGALKHPELVVHEEPMSGVSEASRSIRTNLMFMAPDKPFRTLLVTSAGPAEGKTTVACCIAIAMAQAGKRVLLIDCDLRRPRIHRIFRGRGVDSGPGLTSALLDVGRDDYVLTTEVPNLSVIPAGPIPPNPSELLHSERFRHFLEKVQGQYDQVILDSPPVVAVTDAVILSTMVDSAVLVIRAYKTSKDLAKHGVRLLRDVGAPLTGVVLNAVNVNREEYDYWYKYYRRDGGYSSPAAAASQARAATAEDSADG